MGYQINKFNFPDYSDESLYEKHKGSDDRWSKKFCEWYETGKHADSDTKWNDKCTELLSQLTKKYTVKEIHQMCGGEIGYSTLTKQCYYGQMQESTARQAYYILKRIE